VTEYIGSWRVIMKAIVGSTAYGLDHAGSDIDYLAVGIAPTAHFLGLNAPTKSQATVRHEDDKPDQQTHELGKYCSLALQCNPSIVELLWMPTFVTLTDEGMDLISMRRAFLTARGVRNAYLGYAESQFKKLVARGDGTFSSDTRNRSLKHARHLYRLANQGLELYKTGDLSVRVQDRDAVFAFAEQAIEHPLAAQNWLEEIGRRFDEAKPALPEKPDRDRIEAWLRRTRVKELLAAMGGQYQ
jgi:predicted nucleotidyltransferase